MTAVLMKREILDKDTHTHRETKSEDEDRDLGNASTRQGIPKVANKTPEAK